MASYKNEYANKFIEMMNTTIKQWQEYEKTLYENTLEPICKADSMLNDLTTGGKDGFPHRLWLVWVYGLGERQGLSIDELEKLWQNEKAPYAYSIKGNKLPVEKGKTFEETVAQQIIDNKILKKLASVLPDKLAYIANENKREDFIVNDSFSIDIKYSDLKTDERFKNIIKPWGSDFYTSTNKIQEGIIRSMYKEGATQGQFLPKATGRTKYHGILKYDKKTGIFSEVTQEDYNENNFGPIPSLRKNVLYIYNDDGYWASYCLQKVTDWAANNIEKLGFTNNTRDKNYKSYSANEFWNFDSTDWIKRQTLYGKTE